MGPNLFGGGIDGGNLNLFLQEMPKNFAEAEIIFSKLAFLHKFEGLELLQLLKGLLSGREFSARRRFHRGLLFLLQGTIDQKKDQKKETAQDLAFYRKYRTVDPATKDKVRQMLDLMIKK